MARYIRTVIVLLKKGRYVRIRFHHGGHCSSFHFHRDASIVGVGATLEQEQRNGSIHAIVYISLATIDKEQA